MPDRYQQFITSRPGRWTAKQLGLPTPARLRRHEPGTPFLHGPVVLGSGPGARLVDAAQKALDGLAADVRTEAAEHPSSPYAAVIFDASGIVDGSELREVFRFFHPLIRNLGRSGRLLVLGSPPPDAASAAARTAQRALEGFMRSAGKEMRGGATANLLQVAEGAEDGMESTLRFLLSGRSAFVSGQVLRVGRTEETPAAPDDWDRPLDTKVAVVTGAAQGIGAKIAEVLARDGAEVICLDLPAQGAALSDVANRVGGTTLQLDITTDDAPARLVRHLRDRHGGVDILVHNAGITRDATLVGMDEGGWDAVIAVNLLSQQRINEELLADETLRAHGRVVCISSVSGIAGNRGQANYASAKAGIIGMAEALAPELEGRRGTINVVAPGFIETEMTAEMPLVVREAGRRMNSLNQGGRAVDVAETVAWLANPATAGVNGAVVRVCGQSLLGA